MRTRSYASTRPFLWCALCERPNFHVDYVAACGCNALTPITLEDFDETEAFQLLYNEASEAMEAAEATEAAGATTTRRYVYRRGKALVFGSGFRHSTEPGRSRDPSRPHAYLSFTFGTDRPEHWPMISQTIDSQSRVLARPDGALVLSALGERLESQRAEEPSTPPPASLNGHSSLMAHPFFQSRPTLGQFAKDGVWEEAWSFSVADCPEATTVEAFCGSAVEVAFEAFFGEAFFGARCKGTPQEVIDFATRCTNAFAAATCGESFFRALFEPNELLHVGRKPVKAEAGAVNAWKSLGRTHWSC